MTRRKTGTKKQSARCRWLHRAGGRAHTGSTGAVQMDEAEIPPEFLQDMVDDVVQDGNNWCRPELGYSRGYVYSRV